MKIFNIFLGSVSIIASIIAFVMLIEMLKLTVIVNRMEEKTKISCWGAFTEIDMDSLARRNIIVDEENRNIYIDKGEARKVIEGLLKENMDLDDSFYPKRDKLLIKAYPVKIEQLEIYNPGELPDVAPNGQLMQQTSVYIKLKVPANFKFVGDVYIKIEMVVDTKSFYSNLQKRRNR